MDYALCFKFCINTICCTNFYSIYKNIWSRTFLRNFLLHIPPFFDTLHGIKGLYKVAKECRRITIQLSKNPQWQKQTSPPVDEIIIVPHLPILQKYSLQLHNQDPFDIPVSPENHANEDPWKDYRPKSPSTSSHIKLETPTTAPVTVQEVHPTLGTTTEQRQQLQTATHPLDIQDILGTETLKGKQP